MIWKNMGVLMNNQEIATFWSNKFVWWYFYIWPSHWLAISPSAALQNHFSIFFHIFSYFFSCVPKFSKITFSESKKNNLKNGAVFCIFKDVVTWAFEFRNRLHSSIFDFLYLPCKYFFYVNKVKWDNFATFSPPRIFIH